MGTPPAIAMNHVGVTVTDLDAAIAWYQDVLGYELLAGPLPLIPDDSHFGRLALDILGPRLRSGRFAHLLTANDIGLEIFEFDDPERGPTGEMQYWKNGYFHICITATDVEALVARILEAGGTQRTQVWEIVPGSGHQLAYTADPWGNVIEIYSHSYRDTWSTP